MRLTRLLICILTVAACGTAIPCFAQTPAQVVGAQLDRIATATRSADSATTAIAAWAAKIVGTQRTIDSASTQLRAMLAALAASPTTTPPVVVVVPPKDTAPTKPPVVTAYVRVIGDDYTGYKDTKALLANVIAFAGGTGGSGSLYNDGVNASYASIDETVLYNGHHTAKYSQPAGGSITPELWAALPKTLSKAWFRFKIKYSVGWTTVGTTPNSANAYKIFAWGWQGNNGRGNIVFTNTSEYQVESYVSINGAAANFTYQGGARQTTEWSDGRWYDYIIYSEQLDNSRIRTRWWFAPDGQTPVLKYDLTSVLDTSKYGNAPPIDRVMVGVNYNSARVKAQSLWYGQWEVVDGAQYKNPFGIAGL